MGDLLGYARVSTIEQKAHLQTDALEAAGCIRVWTDKASGTLDHRPQLDRVLDHLRPGDTLVVWRLDRLGRNLLTIPGVSVHPFRSNPYTHSGVFVHLGAGGLVQLA